MNICEREPSISRSYEGSDIVYENLLGDINPNYSCSKTFNINKKIAISSDIEDIFDDDIFDINKEEIEKQNNYLLTDAEEEEEQEEESIEGADPTTTIIKPKPQKIDVFDSILMDLDEKTKEMEKKEKESKKILETNIKHKKNKNKRKKKKSKRKIKKLNKNHKIMHRHNNNNNKKIKKQNKNDKKMVLMNRIAGNTELELELNPWILYEWEYKENSDERRSLRTLLCSVNKILWNEILNDNIAGWEIIKRKDIIYDNDCIKIYNRAINIFNYNKSIQRGDNITKQIISSCIYNALINAYHKLKK